MTPHAGHSTGPHKAPADVALKSGHPVQRAGLIYGPGTFAHEAVANGLPLLPSSWQIRRSDGRTVRVFRVPGVAR